MASCRKICRKYYTTVFFFSRNPHHIILANQPLPRDPSLFMVLEFFPWNKKKKKVQTIVKDMMEAAKISQITVTLFHVGVPEALI